MKRSRDTDSDFNENESIKFWKQKFMEMKELKEESENDVNKLRLLCSQKDQIFHPVKNVVKEAKNDQHCICKSELDKLGELEKLIKITQFYEMMTSMTVKIREDNRYVCTVKNYDSRIFCRFEIKCDLDKSNCEEAEYEPIAGMEALPEQMQSCLSFPKTAAPLLLLDCHTAIFDS